MMWRERYHSCPIYRVSPFFPLPFLFLSLQWYLFVRNAYAFGTLFFVSVAATGRSWVGFLSVMPACVVIR